MGLGLITEHAQYEYRVRMRSFISTAIISSSVSICCVNDCMALQEKFREHGVVPDVIDEPPAELAIVRCAPSVLQRQVFFVFLLTQVKYDCGVTVEPGAILTPTQVRRETPYKEALVPCVIMIIPLAGPECSSGDMASRRLCPVHPHNDR